MSHQVGTPRRLVTGLRPDGTSYFARVEEVEPDSSAGGPIVRYRIWAADGLPIVLPTDGLQPQLASNPSAEGAARALRDSTPLPGPDGLRVSVVSMPPGWTGALHWHDTLDVVWLIAGEAAMILDDGSEEVMRPGDICVAHGTNHNWRVGAEGALVGSVRLGVLRVGPVHPPAAAKTDGMSRPAPGG